MNVCVLFGIWDVLYVNVCCIVLCRPLHHCLHWWLTLLSYWSMMSTIESVAGDGADAPGGRTIIQEPFFWIVCDQKHVSKPSCPTNSCLQYTRGIYRSRLKFNISKENGSTRNTHTNRGRIYSRTSPSAITEQSPLLGRQWTWPKE